MSLGRVFQKVEAATENERRPTADRRYGGTSSCCVNDDRNRRRPGRFDTGYKRRVGILAAGNGRTGLLLAVGLGDCLVVLKILGDYDSADSNVGLLLTTRQQFHLRSTTKLLPAFAYCCRTKALIGANK